MLSPYQRADELTPEGTRVLIRDLLGVDDPGGRARALTRALVSRWRSSQDYAWIALVAELDARLALVLTPTGTGERRRGAETVPDYYAWRARWFASKLARWGTQRPAGMLSRSSRAQARRGLELAERNAARAGTDRSRRRWERRAEHHRRRLITDGVARWNAGKDAKHSSTLKSARQGRLDAVALGWTP